MEPEQAKKLGAMLKQAREALGMSTHQLAAEADLDQATVVRFEAGSFTAPSPDKLTRIAAALGISGADVFALAQYTVPTDLPSFRPYLRTKYRDLPTGEVEKIEAFAAKLARKHGVDLFGPKPGEDEMPDRSARQRNSKRKEESP